MLERRGLTGEGAEIGVRHGIYAKDILLGWHSCITLHLIDPWSELPPDEYHDERPFDPTALERCTARMQPFGDRVTFHQMRSMAAISRFQQHQLSFVYIDANHSYRHALQDAYLWWQKLTPNGVLAGHDIFNPKCPGVTQAVLEFCQHHKRIAHIVPGDLDQHGKLIVEHSWYIFKGDG